METFKMRTRLDLAIGDVEERLLGLALGEHRHLGGGQRRGSREIRLDFPGIVAASRTLLCGTGDVRAGTVEVGLEEEGGLLGVAGLASGTATVPDERHGLRLKKPHEFRCKVFKQFRAIRLNLANGYLVLKGRQRLN